MSFASTQTAMGSASRPRRQGLDGAAEGILDASGPDSGVGGRPWGICPPRVRGNQPEMCQGRLRPPAWLEETKRQDAALRVPLTRGLLLWVQMSLTWRS